MRLHPPLVKQTELKIPYNGFIKGMFYENYNDITEQNMSNFYCDFISLENW